MKLAIATLIAMVFVGGGAAPADEPEAPASPEEIVEYRESGEWKADTTRAVRRARRVLTRHVDDDQAAIVLDVDDTALSTYACMKAAGFDRAEARCGHKRRLPAIHQTLRLFRFARGHDVAIFFVTGRRERLREITVANLRRAGYAGWSGLRMRPDEQPAARKDGWKTRVRRAIERRGRRIIVNLGDQRSDFHGGHALRSIKLPNPMYRIEKA